MSTRTRASIEAYRLQIAIERMAERLGDARLDWGMQRTLFVAHQDDESRDAAERAGRAADRRRKALARLTAALRDLPSKEES